MLSKYYAVDVEVLMFIKDSKRRSLSAGEGEGG